MTVLLIIFTVLIVLVLLFLLFLWLIDTKRYSNLSLLDLYPFIKSWAKYACNGTSVMIDHPSFKVPLRFDKKEFKTKPPIFIFRFMSDGHTRDEIRSVHKVLLNEGIDTKLQLTKSRQLPKEVKSNITIDSSAFPANIVNVVKTISNLFNIEPDNNYRIWCFGRVSLLKGNESYDLIPTTNIFYVGNVLGFIVGRIVNFFKLSST